MVKIRQSDINVVQMQYVQKYPTRRMNGLFVISSSFTWFSTRNERVNGCPFYGLLLQKVGVAGDIALCSCEQ